MKIYDTDSHRSYEIDPNSINKAATKRHSLVHFVILHESAADKWNTPYAAGVLSVSEKVWKKIAYTPRSQWK